MGKITKIEQCKKAKRRTNIFVNERFAFSIGDEVLLREGLFIGQGLTDADLERIKKVDSVAKALESAFRLLSFRQRSRKEIEDKLSGKKYTGKIIETVMLRLEELGYLDDKKFADQWVEERSKKRGPYLLKQELLKKGIDKDIVEERLGRIDKEEEFINAVKLLERDRFRSINDKGEFLKKAGTFLMRRGFSYETVQKVWETRKSP